MRYFKNYSQYHRLNEENVFGQVFSGIWNLLTIGGYIPDEFANTFGFKSNLIKSYARDLERYLKNTLIDFIEDQNLNLLDSQMQKKLLELKNRTNKEKETLKEYKLYNKVITLLKDIEKIENINRAQEKENKIKQLESIFNELDKLKDEQIEESLIKEAYKSYEDLFIKNDSLKQQLTARVKKTHLMYISYKAERIYTYREKGEEKTNNRLKRLWTIEKNKVLSEYENFYEIDTIIDYLQLSSGYKKKMDQKIDNSIDRINTQTLSSSNVDIKKGLQPIKNNDFKKLVPGNYYLFQVLYNKQKIEVLGRLISKPYLNINDKNFYVFQISILYINGDKHYEPQGTFCVLSKKSESKDFYFYIMRQEKNHWEMYRPLDEKPEFNKIGGLYDVFDKVSLQNISQAQAEKKEEINIDLSGLKKELEIINKSLKEKEKKEKQKDEKNEKN